jgi:hypothetical protein
MISKVNENSVILGRLENLVGMASDLSLDNSKEVLWGDLSLLVVNDTSVINIFSVRLVVNLSRELVLRVVSDIIEGEVNDLLGWDSVPLQDLVGVACVSLVSVVVELVRSGNKDSPLGLSLGGRS